MNAPAGMPARQHERIVAAGFRWVLVNRELLAELQVEVVVDVELDTPRERRVWNFLLYVKRERRHRVIGLNVASVADARSAFPDRREAGPSLLLEGVPIDAFEIRREFQKIASHLVVILLRVRSAVAELVENAVEPPLVAAPAYVGLHPSR